MVCLGYVRAVGWVYIKQLAFWYCVFSWISLRFDIFMNDMSCFLLAYHFMSVEGSMILENRVVPNMSLPPRCDGRLLFSSNQLFLSMNLWQFYLKHLYL
jgi:hypothetical protein